MSERILMKFIVGQRVVKEGEDSRFEGEVVAASVKRNLKTMRYVVENDDGVLHIASERQLRLAMPKAPSATLSRLIPGKAAEAAGSARAMAHASAASGGGPEGQLRSV